MQEGVDVKMAKADDVTAKGTDARETTTPGDTLVLSRSAARTLKETSMRVKRIRSAMKTLFRLDERIGRSKRRKAVSSKRKLTAPHRELFVKFWEQRRKSWRRENVVVRGQENRRGAWSAFCRGHRFQPF